MAYVSVSHHLQLWLRRCADSYCLLLQWQVALQHIKDVAKQQKREEFQRTTVEEVKEEHAKATGAVTEAVQNALTQGKAAIHQQADKRKAAQSAAGPSKKPKMMSCLEDLSDVSSSDDEDDA